MIKIEIPDEAWERVLDKVLMLFLLDKIPVKEITYPPYFYQGMERYLGRIERIVDKLLNLKEREEKEEEKG